MRLFLLKTIFAGDFEARREQWRQAHFAYLQKAIDRGDLVLSGHMPKPDGSPFGDGLLVFRSEAAAVEAFAKGIWTRSVIDG